MFSRTSKLLNVVSTGRRYLSSAAERELYRTESTTLTRWLEVGVVRRKGRTSTGDFENTPFSNKNTADFFPTLKAYSLEQKDILVPDQFPAKSKLVFLSFQNFGFEGVRQWMDPIVQRYPDAVSKDGNSTTVKKLEILELSFVEFGFLKLVRNSFASNMKSTFPEQRWSHTGLMFGESLVCATY